MAAIDEAFDLVADRYLALSAESYALSQSMSAAADAALRACGKGSVEPIAAWSVAASSTMATAREDLARLRTQLDKIVKSCGVRP